MTKPKAKAPTKSKAEQLFISTSFLELATLWSNWSNTAMTAVAGWYAATDAAKNMISVTQFASVMAVWGLVNILLRSLKQSDTPAALK